ncbi:DMT family transporter [Alsobacter sp. SYSU BS001988]
MRSTLGVLRGWFFNQPYLLLVFTTLMWGGNVVAGKLAVGEVSPMMVTFLRWFISFGTLAVVARGPILAEWRLLLPSWRYVLMMGAIGFTAFNALFYEAAHYTTAVNIAIIQGSTPIFILIGAVLFFGGAVGPLQAAGVALTILGVALTASHGDVGVLTALSFNRGDLWLLVASVLYAAYTILLRRRPATSGLVFFAALALAACITSIPLVIAEAVAGQLQWPTLKGWAVLLYVAWLPSLLCQICYIRALELIGPSRASAFYNLVPVFGALLSTTLLREPFSLSDALALAMVIGGILVAERGRAR